MKRMQRKKAKSKDRWAEQVEGVKQAKDQKQDTRRKNLKEQSNENCGLAPTSMVVNLAGYGSEVGWQISHIFRYFMIFLFGFSGLLILLAFSKINKSKMNYFSSKINLKFLFFLLALPSILPFLTAVDSGRYMSMAYTFPCIFYYYDKII